MLIEVRYETLQQGIRVPCMCVSFCFATQVDGHPDRLALRGFKDEQLRLKFRDNQGKKPTGSQVIESLLKAAVGDEKVPYPAP